MARWELVPAGSIQRDLAVMTALPANNTDYGAEYVRDMIRPVETWTFASGEGVSAPELAALKVAANTRNVVLTLTDHVGLSYVGRIASLSWEGMGGSDCSSVTITLRSVAGEAPANLSAAVSMAAPL